MSRSQDRFSTVFAEEVYLLRLNLRILDLEATSNKVQRQSSTKKFVFCVPCYLTLLPNLIL